MADKTDKRLGADDGMDLVGTREERSAQERLAVDRHIAESRELTEADRLEMFRRQLFNDALPELPEIPGYHLCWLTTTNPRDPIHRRMQLGYEAVRPEEIPGMEYATLKTGEYAGLIGVNEMVAFKLPNSLYQAFMREAHYDAPLREMEKLNATVDAAKGDAERDGGAIIEDEGFRELRSEIAPRHVYFDD